MAVRTSVFGAVRLTNDDAEKFRQQITYGRPKQAATNALEKGNKMIKEYDKKGFVLISIKGK